MVDHASIDRLYFPIARSTNKFLTNKHSKETMNHVLNFFEGKIDTKIRERKER